MVKEKCLNHKATEIWRYEPIGRNGEGHPQPRWAGSLGYPVDYIEGWDPHEFSGVIGNQGNT